MNEHTLEVTISMEEYQELCGNTHFLGCLISCGVDGWEGYEAAQDMFREGDE